MGLTPDDLERRIEGSIRAVGGLAQRAAGIHAAGVAIATCLKSGGTIYTCGNGGSAAEAMHLAEELIGRYRKGDRPACRAICLNADATALTCIANDFGYEQVFSRQCEALLTGRDVLVALSTSGDSANVVGALRVARARETTTIGLLGRTGGRCREHCDHAILVDADDSAHVQEAHLVVIHLVCEMLE